LAFARELRENSLHVGQEAHVEHAIRFIQHEELQAIEANTASLQVVEQSARLWR
jgi:hypothetical protein